VGLGFDLKEGLGNWIYRKFGANTITKIQYTKAASHKQIE
jgi:hypothetical protein